MLNRITSDTMLNRLVSDTMLNRLVSDTMLNRLSSREVIGAGTAKSGPWRDSSFCYASQKPINGVAPELVEETTNTSGCACDDSLLASTSSASDGPKMGIRFNLSSLRKFALPILLSLISLPAVAQNGSISGQVAAALPTPDGAVLRWFPKNGVLPKNGFKLYRSGGGKDQEIQIESPRPKELVVKMGWMSAKDYDTVVGLFKQPNSSGLNKVMVSLKTLTDANWSKALGLYHTELGLKPGTYQYRLVALEGTTEQELARFSVTTGPTPPVPAPTFEASTLAGKVSLNWKSPPGDHFVAAYRIYRAKGNSSFEIVKPDPYFPSQAQDEANPTFNFSDKKLELGHTYYYTISSVDTFGRESARARVVAVDLAQSQVVRLPELTLVKPLNKKVQLEWTPLDPKQIETVIVLRGTDPDKPLQPITKLPASTTTYTDAEVQAGEDYYYALAVQKGTLLAGPSLMQTVRALNLDPPATPTGLKIVAGKDAVQLNWNANRESDLWGYLVLRSDNAGDPIDGYLALNGSPISATGLQDSLPKGFSGKHVYRVVAVNTSNIRSKPSEPVKSGIINQTAPREPQLLAATPAEGSIVLRFASGYVPDLAKIEVYRSEKEKTELIATLPASATTYTDKAVKAEVRYSYIIRLLDTAGLRSKPSNALEAAAFDLRPPSIPEVQAVAFPGGGVRLAWKVEPGVKYIVYRLNENKVSIQISDYLATGVFNDPEGDKDSTYMLKLLDASGNLSTSKLIQVR